MKSLAGGGWAILAGLASFGTLTARGTDAQACGACFGPPTESTVVSGHRMVFSVSTTQTTLYDQITYQGNPSSFAWVLPIHGEVAVGISANLMFQLLDSKTSHTVQPPPYSCPQAPSNCRSAGGPTFSGAGGSSGGDGVTVLSQETVGPYETVQLSSTDPTALTTWLTTHGYAIPDDMKPVIAGYVSEGMDFLALKLVPGAGISAMRPVRVTTPGASAVLPLRMVAGGTGSTVSITLWVVAEAAYEPQAPFSRFAIKTDDLVWDFASSSSNYKALRDATYQSSQGFAWLTEVSIPFSVLQFQNDIANGLQNPTAGDYAPSNADAGASDPLSARAQALTAAADDLHVLFAGMNASNVRVTRLHGELPRVTLATDLSLQAAADQAEVPTSQQATRFTGQPPCPSFSGCLPNGSGGGPDVGAGGGAGSAIFEDGGKAGSGAPPLSDASNGSSGCVLAGGDLGGGARHSSGAGWFRLLAPFGLFALALVRRRVAGKGQR